MSRDAALSRLRDLIEAIIRGLVDDEDQVEVLVVAETMHTNFTVQVSPRDFGKVIGRAGYTADAVRYLVNVIGCKLALPPCELFLNDPKPELRGTRGTVRPAR